MEFRKIRKKRNEIGIDAAKDLLARSRRGVLAVNGDDGYPYAIPINFLYDGERNQIIFHGAKAGAAAKMCSDDAFSCKRRIVRGDLADDRFVGKPMKAITLDALRIKFGRQCKTAHRFRHGAVKGRVKRGRLRQRRIGFTQGADQGNAARLVQRRKARESLSPQLNAGARIDVAGKPHIVITAAHVFEQRGESSGGGGEFTQLWLGELSS